MKQKIAFWKHHPISDQCGETLAEETIEEYKKFKYDIVKLTPAGSWQATCYGVKDEFQNDHLGRRTITERCIHSLNDWKLITPFESGNYPITLTEQLKAAQIVCEAIKDTPVYATVFSPLTQAVQMVGIDVLKRHMQVDSEIVHQSLEQITQNTILTIDEFKKQGISGIYFVTQAMQTSMFAFEEYKKWGEKYDTLCLKACEEGDKTIFHIHGEEIFLCVHETLQNLQVHYELSPKNLALDAAEKMIAHPIIPGISADLIAQATTRSKINVLLADLFGEAKPAVFCGCVLPLDMTDELIHTWIDTIRNESI